ncbi:MAG TPA: hypothetical protein VMR41_05255 [Patescibacteria group bacterium]|nr:hypothetical protein [Patescibacteria group bacterium]
MKKLFSFHGFILFCAAIIILQFFQVFYLNRFLFFHQYDAAYWKDRFEHSQWTLPLSQRTIGDDGIYNYAGYQLMQGVSIEATNANKPPVGIYLIGLSIVLLHNPTYFAFFSGIATLLCFFFLAKIILKDSKLTFALTALFSLEPFLFSYFTGTTLDLVQLLFLLFNVLMLYLAVEKNNKWQIIFFIILSGISLGFFTETKPPLLLPIVLSLELIYLLMRKKYTLTAIFLVFLAIGVLLPYFRYFELGHNLRDLIKLHKYMASVYYSGHNALHWSAIWQSLLTGYFPDVVTGKLSQIGQWWIVLPIVTILGIYQAIKTIFNKNSIHIAKGLAVFLLLTLLIYTVIPAYYRYLVLIIPMLYIFSAQTMQPWITKYLNIKNSGILLLLGLFYATWLLFPSVDTTLNNFYYNFSHQYFQDMYAEDLAATSQIQDTRLQFRQIAQSALQDATIVTSSIKEISKTVPLFGDKGTVTYSVTYQTRDLGSFNETKTMHLVKENGQWRVVWNWNLLLNQFKPGDTFKTTIQYGKRGTIYDDKQHILAEDTTGLEISVNPDLIDTKQEMEMLNLLHILSFQEKMHIQNAYLENALPNTYNPVVTFFTRPTEKQLAQLKTYPGIKLQTVNTRVYTTPTFLSPISIQNALYDEACTRLYSSTTYHGVSDVEKKYDQTLSGANGGSIIMLQNNIPVRTLITRTAKNGGDITLP